MRRGRSISTNSPAAMLPGTISMRKAPPGFGSNCSASRPFQRASFSGSTRNSHTVSGEASIEISRWKTICSVALILLPLLVFCLAFERLEPRVPELLQELAQLGEALGSSAVEPPGAVASFVHEPGLLQQRQMLRDRRARHVEVRRDLAGRELAVAHEPQDRAAAGG